LLLNLALMAVANLVPVAGVIFLGWSAEGVMLLYWLEMLVIVFYRALQLLLAIPVFPEQHLFKIISVPLFLVMQGGVLFGLVVVELFFTNVEGMDMARVEMATMVRVVVERHTWITVALGMMALSHGASFVGAVVMKGKLRETEWGEVTEGCFMRVYVLNGGIVLGLIMSQETPAPVAIIIGIVALKIVYEAVALIRAHEAREARGLWRVVR
jgi:hypothetical protein